MSIKFHCTQCGRAITAPDSGAGRKGKCSCGAVVTVPRASQVPQAAPRNDVLDAEVLPAEPVLDDLSQEPPLPPAEPDTYGFANESSAPAAAPAEQRRPCPMCGEMIALNAIKCRFCNEIFDPAMKKAQAKQVRRTSRGADYDDDMTGAEWVLAILCSGIGCIVGIVWLIQGKRKGGKMLAVSLITSVIVTIIKFLALVASENR